VEVLTLLFEGCYLATGKFERSLSRSWPAPSEMKQELTSMIQPSCNSKISVLDLIQGRLGDQQSGELYITREGGGM